MCQAAINKDWQLTVRGLAHVGIPKTTVSKILTEGLRMKCIMAKFVPQLLPEQKEHRAAVAADLIHTATNRPDFLKKVITRDEGGYGYDPEMQAQASH